MSKIQVFFLSLVGALPAGYLSYLLGMYLISQPTGASSMVMIISIITLICTATLTVVPFLVLAMYHSNYDPPKAPKKSKSKKDDEDSEDVDETEEISDAKGKKKSKVADADEFADDDVLEDEVTEEVPLDDDDFAVMDDEELTMDDDEEK